MTPYDRMLTLAFVLKLDMPALKAYVEKMAVSRPWSYGDCLNWLYDRWVVQGVPIPDELKKVTP